MGISSIIRFIPEAVSSFRIYGNNTIMRKCMNVGRELEQTAKQNGGQLSIDELNLAYKKILPKGSQIEVTNDSSQLAKFLKSMNFSDDVISYVTNSAQAMVVGDFKGKTMFFLPIEKFLGDKAVNVATHEFEHVLNQNYSLNAKFQKILMKILGPARVEKMALKDSERINMQNMRLQQDLIGQKLKISDPVDGVMPEIADKQGLIEHLGMASGHKLDVKLRQSVRKILEPEAEKDNIKTLKALDRVLPDEARAYQVGGKTAGRYLNLTEGATTSEMTSQLYTETVKAVKRELKSQNIKKIKRALGFKVRNYEGVKDFNVQISTRVLDPREQESIAKIFSKDAWDRAPRVKLNYTE